MEENLVKTEETTKPIAVEFNQEKYHEISAFLKKFCQFLLFCLQLR